MEIDGVEHWPPSARRQPSGLQTRVKIVFRPGFATRPEGFAMSTLALTQRSLVKPQRKEEKLSVCSGSMSLTPEDRVEVLAVLTRDEDPDIAERAQNALL